MEDASSQHTSNDVTQDLRSIYDRGDEIFRLSLLESADKLQCYMKIVCGSGSNLPSPDDIMNIIKEQGITTGIMDQAISQALSDPQKALEPVLIAEGRPPENGPDGTFEILFDPDSPYVEKDQVLLCVTEPGDGRDGVDIYGKAIPFRLGRFPEITCGANVIEEKSNQFVSDLFGKAVFINNILSVEKILFVNVSDDAMEASLMYAGGPKLSHERIMNELYANGVTFGIDKHAVDYIVSAFNDQGEQVENIIIAKGRPPQPGRDGVVTFHFETTKKPTFIEKDDGSVDLREMNLVPSVESGTELATLQPHIDPKPGKTVYGKVVNLPKVKKVSIRAGKNVTTSEDGQHFLAAVDGRPLLEGGDKICVSEILSIPGNIDYAVGNIDFNGIVQIGGDVEDGFKVKATKSIIIRGIVGACELDAGLDIQIIGGCNGKGDSSILCAGDFAARYINEVNLTARGNATIRNEIVNSTVKILGRLEMKPGSSIRGGNIKAKKGIEAYDAGSELGVKTILCPGDDYELTEKCNTIDAAIIEKNEEILKINERIAPLFKNREALSKLPQEQRNKLKETIHYLKSLQQEKDSLNTYKNELIAMAMQDAIPEVIIQHYIFHGVILKVGTARREIASQLEGPLRLYEHDKHVSVEPYGEKARQRSLNSLANATVSETSPS